MLKYYICNDPLLIILKKPIKKIHQEKIIIIINAQLWVELELGETMCVSSPSPFRIGVKEENFEISGQP